mmetsp:Transcript_37564/g.43748  ORF Transcript_37564/g.43748 Transcript_37564/m.43748 type:complete len:93 (+) Transcript_37564:40-318(+)
MVAATSSERPHLASQKSQRIRVIGVRLWRFNFRKEGQETEKPKPKGAKGILKRYNGDVQKGTVERTSKARADLPFIYPALAEATALYEDETR